MAEFDDMESTEKVRIYDHGVDAPGYASYGEALTLRFGDIVSPRLDLREPLRLEAEHFLDCLRRGTQPLSDGQDGLRVLRVLTAAQQSLANGGVPVAVQR
jgi:predicted dehydrogenase